MDASLRRDRLNDALLYPCVDRRARQEDLVQWLDAVLGAGADIVQLRDKEATRSQLLVAAEAFRAAADRHGALFVLNDDPALAVEAGADGVHVGQDDLDPAAARAIVGPDLLVGWSTHDRDQIDLAVTGNCDYFAVGPVYATPTKQGRPAIGLGPLRHAAAVAGATPWFVTGAMSRETAPAVLAAGARRLVVVRAVTEAADPAAAAASLVALLRG